MREPPDLGAPSSVSILATRGPWHRSVVTRSLVFAFIGTHVPLLAMIAFLVLWPERLGPWQVFGVTLVATLLATAALLGVLWRMFRPLRQAADGLIGYMIRGDMFRVQARERDEVGRLVQLLVLALGHLDRGRAALLKAGVSEIELAQLSHGGEDPLAPQLVAMAEVGDWVRIESEAKPRRMQDVQDACLRTIKLAMPPDALVMPWGRGRVLVVLPVDTDQARQALDRIPSEFRTAANATTHALRVVVAPASAGTLGWSSALQRLDRKLFELSLQPA